MSPRAVAAFIRFAILTFNLIVATLIIRIGEEIEALHRLDDVFAPYAATLKVLFPILIALGFAMFMGGIVWMLFRGGGNEGTMYLREVRDAFRNGTWRTGRMQRFFVIAGGVALMIVTAFAAGIVFGEAGLRLLLLVVLGYAAIKAFLRLFRSRLR